MEDLDTPRCIPGAAEGILRTLEAFGLHSDEPVVYQSRRTAAYEEALHTLRSLGVVYPCSCTRKEIADSAQHGIDGLVYPGTCRNGIPADRQARAWRVRTDDEAVEFDDALQGHLTQRLESEIGDFVVKRADGLFAYQLAVVIDDAHQGITHIVRGADLLHSTARQIYLQRLLGLPTPAYIHLPIAVNAHGEKLSKQTRAPAITSQEVVGTLIGVLTFLGQHPPGELRGYRIDEVLRWAIDHWRPDVLKGCYQLPVPTH